MNDEWLLITMFVNNRDEAQNIYVSNSFTYFYVYYQRLFDISWSKKWIWKKWKKHLFWQFSISFEGMIYMCGSMQQYMTVCFIVIEICLQK